MADRLGVKNRLTKRRMTLRRSNLVTNSSNSVLSGSKRNPENKSDTSEGNRQKQVNTFLENTYRMMPPSEERFDVSKVEELLAEILSIRLKDVDYDGGTCSELCKELTRTIIARTKEFGWQRYKLVAQVHLGQKDNQGLRVASRCIWDANSDTFACASFNNHSLFAVASCYGIYFE